jgi:CheY-like chemotaxis protein
MGPHGGVVTPKTGDILIERGLATREQVEAAVREGELRREPLCSRLLSAGVPEGALVSVLSEKHGVPGVDLSRTAVALPLLALVPYVVAEGDLILPLSEAGGRIHLAMAHPGDERILAEVRFHTGREISPYVGVRAALAEAVQQAYEARERGEPLWCGADAGPGGAYLAAVAPGGDLDGTEIAATACADAALEECDDGPDEQDPPPPRRGPRPLVLVVDDEPEIRQLVRRTLEGKGHDVESAADGAEALETAAALVPDLVLVDAMLPRVQGFEVSRRIKASRRTRNVPVVMMTSAYRGWRLDPRTIASYGAEHHLEKPFRLDELLRRVDAALAAPRPEIGASSAAPLLARARALLAAGEADQAIEALSEATRADPHSAAAHLRLGCALRRRGDGFRAMTELERAAELRPSSVWALRALAGLYEQTGFRRKAAETLSRALAAARDDETRAAVRSDLQRLEA